MHSASEGQAVTDIFEQLINKKPDGRQVDTPPQTTINLATILDDEHEQLLALARFDAANSSVG